MKTTITAIVLLLFATGASAQKEPGLSRQEKKALREEQKKQEEAMLAHNTSTALQAKQFVLKADQLRGRTGLTVNVNPTINFIAVEGKDAYVQVASPSGTGLNGLGGVTLKGKITSMEISKSDKNGFYSVTMNTMGNAGHLTIAMNVSQTGEMASATVRTNYGGRIEMNGELVPWTGTGKTIYKGQERY
jgi:hypothetical protein